MSSRNTSHHKKKKAKYQKPIAEKADQVSANPPDKKRLEIVLKCETSGYIEAIVS